MKIFSQWRTIVAVFGLLVCDSPNARQAEIWTKSLPPAVQASILWCADHEEGTLFDWEYDKNSDTNGGGILNTGNPDEAMVDADASEPFTGKYCAKATIRNAFQSKNGAKAVRLMRWTDKPWDQGGQYFPRLAYYGVWMRLDHRYTTSNPAKKNGGWWNVFQFKSEDENNESQPVWVLNIGNDEKSGEMVFYLFSDYNRMTSVSQPNPVPIPVGRWFHVEVLYEQSRSNTADGNINVWQDGKQILDAQNVRTVLARKTMWGIGNYTDHIMGNTEPGTATIYFDDATISTLPTHEYVEEMLKNKK